MRTSEEIYELFAVGAKVRFESEMYEGKWEYGEVTGHTEHNLFILSDDGEQVAYDYRYLDTNPHNSLVRLVK